MSDFKNNADHFHGAFNLKHDDGYGALICPKSKCLADRSDDRNMKRWIESTHFGSARPMSEFWMDGMPNQ